MTTSNERFDRDRSRSPKRGNHGAISAACSTIESESPAFSDDFRPLHFPSSPENLRVKSWGNAMSASTQQLDMDASTQCDRDSDGESVSQSDNETSIASPGTPDEAASDPPTTDSDVSTTYITPTSPGQRFQASPESDSIDSQWCNEFSPSDFSRSTSFDSLGYTVICERFHQKRILDDTVTWSSFGSPGDLSEKSDLQVSECQECQSDHSDVSMPQVCSCSPGPSRSRSRSKNATITSPASDKMQD